MAAEQMHTYKWPWRHTIKTGALTVYIGICLTCKRVIEPTRTERSRTGTHGTDYWAHEHPLNFIKLEQSNSGLRHVYCYGAVPEDLCKRVRDEWRYGDTGVWDIIRLIERWLHTHKVA